MKARAGQGVADADADRVGQRVAHQLNSGHDVVESFARVAKLDKEASLDASRAQSRARHRDLLDLRALFHRVENALATALSAHPNLDTAGLFEASHRLFGH